MAGGKAKINPSKSKYHPDQKGFGSFIYDSEEGTCFGRTATSWLKITVFYIIFYAFLSGFFVLNYWIFSHTLNDHSPRWQLEGSIIGTNPGIGYRPMPDQDANAESALIWYKHKDEKDAYFWYNQLKDTVDKTRAQPDIGTKNCTYENGEIADEDLACNLKVDLAGLDRCDISSKFGYPEGKPCILIKLNKIFGWRPEPFGMVDGRYNADQLKDELEDRVANEEMPDHLRRHILDRVRASNGKEVNVLNTVWLSCSGENVGDKENLPDGHMSFYPNGLRGIPGYYFPYYNQAAYISPFVMVHLDIPDTSRHVLINIECRAWAKNTKYDRQFRAGSVHFEIMVD